MPTLPGSSSNSSSSSMLSCFTRCRHCLSNCPTASQLLHIFVWALILLVPTATHLSIDDGWPTSIALSSLVLRFYLFALSWDHRHCRAHWLDELCDDEALFDVERSEWAVAASSVIAVFELVAFASLPSELLLRALNAAHALLQLCLHAGEVRPLPSDWATAWSVARKAVELVYTFGMDPILFALARPFTPLPVPAWYQILCASYGALLPALAIDATTRVALMNVCTVLTMVVATVLLRLQTTQWLLADLPALSLLLAQFVLTFPFVKQAWRSTSTGWKSRVGEPVALVVVVGVTCVAAATIARSMRE